MLCVVAHVLYEIRTSECSDIFSHAQCSYFEIQGGSLDLDCDLVAMDFFAKQAASLASKAVDKAVDSGALESDAAHQGAQSALDKLAQKATGGAVKSVPKEVTSAFMQKAKENPDQVKAAAKGALDKAGEEAARQAKASR